MSSIFSANLEHGDADRPRTTLPAEGNPSGRTHPAGIQRFRKAISASNWRTGFRIARETLKNISQSYAFVESSSS